MHALRTLLAALAVFTALTLAALAQQGDGPDYEAWQSVATRVEAAIESGRASDSEFEARRAEISDWRQRFQNQLSTNDSRIATIRGQIEALGPAPEEGTTEPPEIAQRRAELQAQLERLSTPRRAAEEAFSRANGIISEIDTILRRRQAEELLNAGPTPFNPALWPGALADLYDSLRLIGSGISSAIDNPSNRKQARDNLPLILFLFVLGIVLIGKAREWSERIALRISTRSSHARSQLAAFAVSLGQILFPVLGTISLLGAATATEFYGPRGEVILQTLLRAVVVISVAGWLGGRMFPKADGIKTPLGIEEGKRRRARLFVTALGLLIAVAMLRDSLSEYDRYAPETVSVLAFPILLLSSICLIGLGRIIRSHDAEQTSFATPGAYRHQLIRSYGRAAVLVGFFGPVLAAAGYTVAAETLVFPTILTLALIAGVAILQDLVRAAYAALIPGEGAGEGLIPTLIGFTILLMSLPVVALIWGARVTDLTELWAQMRAGIQIGDTTISPGAFLTLIAVFVVGYLLTRALQGSLRTTILPKTNIDPGGQTALVAGVGYIGIFLAAIISISAAGLDLSNIALVAGALSVGIGFGLQNIVSNFVSGIILLIERPISEGDWIEVGGQHGYVRKVSVRSTRIETFDRTDVIVPNADLVSGTVTNYTRGNTIGRAIVAVGVAYGTDTRRVEGILREIAEAHPMVLANPAPSIVFAGFGASSLDFEIRAILRDVNFMLSVKTELHHQIAERFVAEGIEIPFAQTDIWLRNPETLRSETS